MTAETSHKWATVFIEGDYEEFSKDLRGGKNLIQFMIRVPRSKHTLKVEHTLMY